MLISLLFESVHFKQLEDGLSLVFKLFSYHEFQDFVLMAMYELAEYFKMKVGFEVFHVLSYTNLLFWYLV